MCNPVKPIRLKGISDTDIFVNPSHIIKINKVVNQNYYEVLVSGHNTLFIEDTLELKAYLGIL